MQISDDRYNEISEMCKTLVTSNRVLSSRDASRFPEVQYSVIQHIYRQTFHLIENEQEKSIKSNIKKLNGEFDAGKDVSVIASENGILLHILLRHLIKYRLGVDFAESKRFFQNPSLIPDKHIAQTIRECDLSSVLEVTRNDKIRQSSGLEYEYLLQEKLRNLDIPFTKESELRKAGLSKTPDIVLDYPISIMTKTYLSKHFDDVFLTALDGRK